MEKEESFGRRLRSLMIAAYSVIQPRSRTLPN